MTKASAGCITYYTLQSQPGSLEWLLKGITKLPVLKQHSERRGCFSGYSVDIKSETSVWCCVPSRKNIWIQRPRGRSISGLTYHMRTLLPVASTLGTKGLVIMVPNKGILLPEDAGCVPLNYKLWSPPGHFGLLIPRDQQAIRGVTIIARVMDADH